VRVARAYVYAVLAVAVAVAYGVWVGPYWVTDTVVLAVMASAVAFLCFGRGVEAESIFAVLRMGTKVGNQYAPEPSKRQRVPDQRERVSRSRIAHYVTLSRIKSTALDSWLRQESDSPFERALLSEPGWRRLSGENLMEITRKFPDDYSESTQ